MSDRNAPRILFTNAQVFDGSGAAPSSADIALDGPMIADIGPGLDGDTSIDLDGKAVIPGLFDCHTHFMLSHVHVWRHMQMPASYRYFEAVGHLAWIHRTTRTLEELNSRKGASHLG